MSKVFVVSVHRDRWFWPKLTIVIEARVPSAAAGHKHIAKLVMAAYYKRQKGKFSRRASMRVNDYVVVDEMGLKRLQAAAKASVTLRRKRAAKKAAATRARNRSVMSPRERYFQHEPYSPGH